MSLASDVHSSRKLTVPNVLTVLRMVMSVIAAWGFTVAGFGRWAVGLCVGAALLDVFDGWYARRFSQCTYLGKHLDPLADKFLIAVVYGTIAVKLSSGLAWALVVGIGVREIAMTIFRSYSLRRHGRFIPANRWGKFKMILQSTVGLAVLSYIYYIRDGEVGPLAIVVPALFAILVVSYLSAGIYVRRWFDVVRAETDDAAAGVELARRSVAAGE